MAKKGRHGDEGQRNNMGMIQEKGKLITFEGSEGSGKSTQIAFLEKYLKDRNKKVICLREPGGVRISEAIREILLDEKNNNMTNECEMLLYMAARSQLVKEEILPALEGGNIVLCDRYLDSTIAYQGYGNGVNIDTIKKVGLFATFGIIPDLTLIFDIDIETGFTRIRRKKDRIEQREISYHQRVSCGYLELAKENPRRIKVIDAHKDKETIREIVINHVDEVLNI